MQRLRAADAVLHLRVAIFVARCPDLLEQPDRRQPGELGQAGCEDAAEGIDLARDRWPLGHWPSSGVRTFHPESCACGIHGLALPVRVAPGTHRRRLDGLDCREVTPNGLTTV